MSGKRMENITISLPEPHLDMIETIIQLGIVSSRSECIRNAIRDFLYDEQNFLEHINTLNENIEVLIEE